jgi:transcription initiation factor TFIID subunit 6
LYGFSHSGPVQFKKVTGSAGTLFYLDDEELDFEDIINAPMPKVPLDVTFTGNLTLTVG